MANNSELFQIIKSESKNQEKITFARYMELALYHPTHGYYASGEPLRNHQDFYTSPGAHPVFGALIALQLEQMWGLLDKPHPFWIVEQGAGSGLLGQSVIGFLQEYSPELFQAATYVMIDRASLARSPEVLIQCQRLRSRTLPFKNLVGCILSNELLDAFPVHRVRVKDGKLQEIYVTVDGDKLIEALGEPSTSQLAQRLQEEGIALEEGQQAEINLGIEPWITEVSNALSKGFLLTVDYGDLASALYAPPRRFGTLLGYYKHIESYDPFAHLGYQDLTAHVDFTAVINKGKEHGFKVVGIATQRDFLINLGMQSFINALGKLDLPQPVADANRFGMMELINPEGMGKFKVLALSKGMPEVKLDGFYPDNTAKGALPRGGNLKSPLLGQEHIALLAGKYPHLAWDWQELFKN